MNSCVHYKNNLLCMEGVQLDDIANQFGTPCYVYSATKIINNYEAFHAAFKNIPHTICYAVKANASLAILNLLAKSGAGFDIVSLGELERVLKAGGAPEKIVFSGVGKQQHEIIQAINHGIQCIDVESEPELERINIIANQLNKKVNIALRVNPNVNPNTHAHITTGLTENKFGIELNQIIPLCNQLPKMPNLTLTGLAVHIGSQITELQPFLDAIDQLLELYQTLKSLGFKLTHINIGGGLGIAYDDEKPPTLQEYADAIIKKIEGRALHLILEPGRAIIGNAGILLTRVEYIKETTHKNFAIVDAGMNDLIRPALYDAWHPIFPMQKSTHTTKQYDIAGPVCESADFLGKNRALAIEPGDLLAIDCAGAYGFSMSSNYNSRGRAAEVLVLGDRADLVRRRETTADLFANEMMPAL